MKYKGVIFDLDGTLLNSIEDLAESMNTVLKKSNFPTHKASEYENYIGSGILNLVQKALPESHRDSDNCMKYFHMMFEEYSKNCTNKTAPYEGIAELLDKLEANYIKMGILSNKADKLTKKAVQVLLPNWNFECVEGLTSEEHKKPNPIKALHISKKMGIDPNEIIFVGDSGVDMETANNAGMYAVGVLWGFRSKEELISTGANKIISHPLELLNIL